MAEDDNAWWQQELAARIERVNISLLDRQVTWLDTEILHDEALAAVTAAKDLLRQQPEVVASLERSLMLEVEQKERTFRDTTVYDIQMDYESLLRRARGTQWKTQDMFRIVMGTSPYVDYTFSVGRLELECANAQTHVEETWHKSKQMRLLSLKYAPVNQDQPQHIPQFDEPLVSAHAFDADLDLMRQALARLESAVSALEHDTMDVLEGLVLAAHRDDIEKLEDSEVEDLNYTKNLALDAIDGFVSSDEQKQERTAAILRKHNRATQ